MNPDADADLIAAILSYRGAKEEYMGVVMDRLTVPDPATMSPHDIGEYVTGVIDPLQQAAAASAKTEDPRPVNFGWLPPTDGQRRRLIPIGAGCIRMISGYKLAISCI